MTGKQQRTDRHRENQRKTEMAGRGDTERCDGERRERQTDRQKQRREWGRGLEKRKTRPRKGRRERGEERQRGWKTERLTNRWLHRDRDASEGTQEGHRMKYRPKDTVMGPRDEAHAEIGREGEEKRKKQRRE